MAKTADVGWEGLCCCVYGGLLVSRFLGVHSGRACAGGPPVEVFSAFGVAKVARRRRRLLWTKIGLVKRPCDEGLNAR